VNAPEPVLTEAERAFNALADDRRLLLLQRVFEILEYDDEGNPGDEWSSNTTQALGEMFENFGVKFTASDDVKLCDGCGLWMIDRDGAWVHRDGTSACPEDADEPAANG
jgi:hypothetical protein